MGGWQHIGCFKSYNFVTDMMIAPRLVVLTAL